MKLIRVSSMVAICVAVAATVGSSRSGDRQTGSHTRAAALSGSAPLTVSSRGQTSGGARDGSIVSLPAVTPMRTKPLRRLVGLHSAAAAAAPARLPEVEQRAQLPFSSKNAKAAALVPASKRVAPPPLRSFEGITSASSRNIPPDTDGDVGPNHYVQIVNTSFAVWNKLGVPTLAPTDEGIFWSNAARGNVCRFHDIETDGVVLYDQLANRWLFSYLALNFGVDGEPIAPYYECIAVSSGPDPLASWCAYSFRMDALSHGGLPDYPKFGVWPDGYSMTANVFGSNRNVTDLGVSFDRGRMLRCRPARVRGFTIRDPIVMLPADLDGPTRPPVGSPEYFVVPETNATTLRLYRFRPNWPGRAPARAPRPTRIGIAPVNAVCPNPQCIPQRASAIKLDGLDDGRLMYRLVYRNFGDHEALLLNHTAGASPGHAGVRWYEIRNPRAHSFLYQQGTYAPDGDSRWLGSLAFDKVGDIAALYNVSGPGTFPSLRYSTRTPSDPLGSFGAGEATLAAGGGPITSGYGPGGQSTRWGDYESLTVDPVDDCTFWATGEYLSHPGDFQVWQTRIGAFKLPNCV